MLQTEPIHFTKNESLDDKYKKIVGGFNRQHEHFKELIGDHYIKKNIRKIEFYFTEEKLNRAFGKCINMVFNLTKNIDLEQDMDFIIRLKMEVFDHFSPFFEKFYKNMGLGQIIHKDVYVMHMTRLSQHFLISYRVYNEQNLFKNP